MTTASPRAPGWVVPMIILALVAGLGVGLAVGSARRRPRRFGPGSHHYDGRAATTVAWEPAEAYGAAVAVQGESLPVLPETAEDPAVGLAMPQITGTDLRRQLPGDHGERQSQADRGPGALVPLLQRRGAHPQRLVCRRPPRGHRGHRPQRLRRSQQGQLPAGHLGGRRRLQPAPDRRRRGADRGARRWASRRCPSGSPSSPTAGSPCGARGSWKRALSTRSWPRCSPPRRAPPPPRPRRRRYPRHPGEAPCATIGRPRPAVSW